MEEPRTDDDEVATSEQELRQRGTYVDLEVLAADPGCLWTGLNETITIDVTAAQVRSVPVQANTHYKWTIDVTIRNVFTQAVVRTFSDVEPFDETCGSSCNTWNWPVTWDGRNSQGQFVPAGEYSYEATVVLEAVTGTTRWNAQTTTVESVQVGLQNIDVDSAFCNAEPYVDLEVFSPAPAAFYPSESESSMLLARADQVSALPVGPEYAWDLELEVRNYQDSVVYTIGQSQEWSGSEEDTWHLPWHWDSEVTGGSHAPPGQYPYTVTLTLMGRIGTGAWQAIDTLVVDSPNDDSVLDLYVMPDRDRWVVHITDPTEDPDEVASDHGLMNLGQVGALEDTYLYHRGYGQTASNATITAALEAETFLEDVELEVEQVMPTEHKSDPAFSDPVYAQQWQIRDSDVSTVLDAWNYNGSTFDLTGAGVNVAVVDSTVQFFHPDLLPNWSYVGSWDAFYSCRIGEAVLPPAACDPILGCAPPCAAPAALNPFYPATTLPSKVNDLWPDPPGLVSAGRMLERRALIEGSALLRSGRVLGTEGSFDAAHGTQAAGVLCGAVNRSPESQYCGAGVAFSATMGAIALDVGAMSSVNIASALTHCLVPVSGRGACEGFSYDIYSNSWGNSEYTRYYRLPRLVEHALETGVTIGRGGKGAIYVFSGGNGGGNRYTDEFPPTTTYTADYMSMDPLPSSRFTIAVGAHTAAGTLAAYSEAGPALLVLAPGGSIDPDDLSPLSTIPTTGMINALDAQTGGYRDAVSAAWCSATHGENVDLPEFAKTSAAAPAAAGVVALMLEANPTLSWRAVQHILVETAAAYNAPNDTNLALKQVSLPDLTANTANIADNGVLESIEVLGRREARWIHLSLVRLPALKSVGGVAPQFDALSVVDTPELTSLQSLRVVGDNESRSIPGGIRIDGAPMLQELPQVDASRAIRVQILRTGLPRVDGLSGVTVLSELLLVDNPLLVDLNALASLSTVERDLWIARNPQLAQIAPLDGLGRVGDNLTIRDNPQVPTCQAQALVDGLDVPPTSVTIEGNDDAATCP